MTLILVSIFLCLACWAFGNTVWLVHRQHKFDELIRESRNNRNKWEIALDLRQHESCEHCKDIANNFLTAMDLATGDIAIWPWQWVTHWRRDYLAEAQRRTDK